MRRITPEAVRRLGVWLEYGFLSLLIVGPLFAYGYVLTLDMVWVPRIPLPTSVDNTYPFWALLHYLSLVIPSELLQKLVLFTIFVLAGVGAHKLVQFSIRSFQFSNKRVSPASQFSNSDSINENSKLKIENSAKWGCYFAGILFAINPFTYSRLMAGQWLVLAGYALLPWFTRALVRFIRAPSLRTAWPVAAWALAISVLSIHAIFFMVLIAATVIAVEFSIFNFQFTNTHSRNENYKLEIAKLARWGLAIVATLIIAGSYWLVPLVQGKGPVATAIGSFDSQSNQAFKTDGGELGLPLNVLALSGAWTDRQERYLLPSDGIRIFNFQFSIFKPIAMIILLLAFLGAWISIKRCEPVGIALTFVGLIAAGLAVGEAWWPLAPVNHWLSAHVPFFGGYREPGKFVALTALGASYLGGVAIGQLGYRVQGKAKFSIFNFQFSNPKPSTLNPILMSLLLLIPIAYTPLMLWGGGGQLKSADYPFDWYTINNLLQENHSAKALFLPWHQYMRFDFAGRVAANPASQFFSTPVVAGNDPELPSSEYRVSSDTKFVHELAEQGGAGEDVSPLLGRAGFDYVIVYETADWQNYSWLKKQQNVKSVYKGEGIILYKVKYRG